MGERIVFLQTESFTTRIKKCSKSMKYLAVASLIFSVIFYHNICPSVLKLCELKTCPHCYGTNLCSEIQENKVVLQFNCATDFIYNIFSVKNVYFARYNNRSVVLKKLAHNSELKELDEKLKSSDVKEIMNFLISDVSVKHFTICDKNTSNSFLRVLSHKDHNNLQTLLQINVEPLLLEIFENYQGWCTPKLYGFCGRLVVVENAGHPLNHIKSFNWFDRAYVAYQILQAANNFTKNHDIFRLYLTDISPDNIAINDDLRVTFVDLENAILKKKNDNGKTHYSEHFVEDYAYSESQICGSSISDHNIYSACRLLLSKKAPWPMMENGLLHSPPKIISEIFNETSLLIESCVYSENKINRFKLSKDILSHLKNILIKYTKYFA